MSDSTEAIELVLEGSAKSALNMIVGLLGEGATEEDAVKRALGTELYLLQRIKEGGIVIIQGKTGEREEIDLLAS